MAFIIANILPLETINELNINFDMAKFKLTIGRLKVKPRQLPKIDSFSFFDKLMREDDEVIYERNTY